MNNYHHADEWSGGAWLTAGDSSAVIFVGTKGTGDCWYGCPDGTVSPREPLIRPIAPTGGGGALASKGGSCSMIPRTSPPWPGKMTLRAQPYASLNIDKQLFNVSSSQQKYHVGAASSIASGILYLFEPLADGDKSLVHA